MNDSLKIAILDMNADAPNEGMRCIKMLAGQFLANDGIVGNYDVFDVRIAHEMPRIEEYDLFISSGGPGSPIPVGAAWEQSYFDFLDNLLTHNLTHPDKKYIFLICHSFQLACVHWDLGKVTRRRSTSFGVLPMHKTDAGEEEVLFKGLNTPFYAVDSRDYQVLRPKKDKLRTLGGRILAKEKIRPHILLERAVMAIRFTKEIVGTQFHPEADAEGMMRYFKTEAKQKQIIKHFGKKKYQSMMEQLDDEDKIARTHATVIPGFLERSAQKVLESRMVVS